MQSVLWWGIVVLGAVVVVAALAWRLVPLSRDLRSRWFAPLRLLIVGAVLLFLGIVGGWVVPVGAYCSGAFGSQEPARVELQITGVANALKACQSAAPGMSLLWWSIIIAGLFAVASAIVWAALRAGGVGAKLSLKTPRREPSFPLWPFILGGIVVAAGVFFGNVLSVGTNCGGAFSDQTSASGADLANALQNRSTNYAETCRMLAGQQAGTYWGVIGFGASLIVLGFVLMRVLPLLAAAARPAEANLAAELRQLAGLRDGGILTEDEFRSVKERLVQTHPLPQAIRAGVQSGGVS